MITLSVQTVVSALIWLLILGAIFGLLWWAIHKLPIFEPFVKVGEVIIIIAAVLLLINVLLALGGHPLFAWKS